MLPQPHGVVHGEARLLVTPAVPRLEALPVLGVLDALLDLALLLHVLGLVLRQQGPDHNAHSLRKTSLGKIHKIRFIVTQNIVFRR